jgi:hypothetical protein
VTASALTPVMPWRSDLTKTEYAVFPVEPKDDDAPAGE